MSDAVDKSGLEKASANASGQSEKDRSKGPGRRKWVRRLFFALVSFGVFWVVADFTYSAIVAGNRGRWFEKQEFSSDGIRKGCEPLHLNPSSEHAILMVHGINDCPAEYRKVAKSLSESGYETKAILLPGFGRGHDQYQNAKLDDWLAAVKSEVSNLRKSNNRVFLMGHSLGGAIVTQFVLQEPDAVDGLILAAPALEVSSDRSPLFPVRFWHNSLSATLIFTDTTQSPFGVDALDPVVKKGSLRTPFTPLSIIDQTFEVIDKNSGRGEEINVPVLMILAEKDRVISNDAAKQFYEAISSTSKQLVVVNNSGHAILVDYEWQTVAKSVESFLAAVKGAE